MSNANDTVKMSKADFQAFLEYEGLPTRLQLGMISIDSPAMLRDAILASPDSLTIGQRRFLARIVFE